MPLRDFRTVLLIGIPAVLAIAALVLINEFSEPGAGDYVPVRPELQAGSVDLSGPPPPPDRWRREVGPPVLMPGLGPPSRMVALPTEDRVLSLQRMEALLAEAEAGSFKAWQTLYWLVRNGEVGDWFGVEALLLKALRDNIHNAPIFVAKILPFLKDKDALRKAAEDLFELVGEAEDANVLRAAFQLLGEVGSPEDASRLAGLARIQERREVFAQAVYALAEVGGKEAALALASLLADQVGTNREDLVIKALARSTSPSTVTALLPLLGEGNTDELRVAAARALGLCGNPEAIEPLRDLVRDEGLSRDLARTAIQSLGELGTKEAFEELRRIREEGGQFSALAGQAYESISDPEALSAVCEAFKEEVNVHVRRHLVNAMGRMGSEEAVPLLTSVLNSGEEVAGLRGGAARALAEIGSPDSVQPIVKALRETDDQGLQVSLAQALTAMQRHPAARPVVVERALPAIRAVLDRTSKEDGSYYLLYQLMHMLDAGRPRGTDSPR